MANAISRIVLSFCLCQKVILRPVRLASVVTILSWSLGKGARHGSCFINFSTPLKSSHSLPVQFHFGCFRSNCLTRLVFSKKLGRNFAINCIASRNDFRSLPDVEVFSCEIAFFFFPCSVLFHARFFCVPGKFFFEEKVGFFSHLHSIPFFEVSRAL